MIDDKVIERLDILARFLEGKNSELALKNGSVPIQSMKALAADVREAIAELERDHVYFLDAMRYNWLCGIAPKEVLKIAASRNGKARHINDCDEAIDIAMFQTEL